MITPQEIRDRVLAAFLEFDNYDHEDQRADIVMEIFKEVLAARDAAFISEIAGLQKDTGINGKTPLMYVRKGYNQALADALNVLRKK